jgi:hypothetical protein
MPASFGQVFKQAAFREFPQIDFMAFSIVELDGEPERVGLVRLDDADFGHEASSEFR